MQTDSTKRGDMEQWCIEHAVSVRPTQPDQFIDCVYLEELLVAANQFDQVQARLLKFADLIYGFTSADSAGHMRYLHEQASIALDRPQHVASQPTIADIREEDEPRA